MIFFVLVPALQCRDHVRAQLKGQACNFLQPLIIQKIYSEDVSAINPAINPTPICTLTAAAAPVGTLVLVDVADGTTTADDDDALVAVAVALLAGEVVGAELPPNEDEDEDDSEDAAVAVATIVVLSEAETVAEAVAVAEYALAILSIAVVSPLR